MKRNIIENGTIVKTKDSGELVKIISSKETPTGEIYYTHSFLDRKGDKGTRLNNDSYLKVAVLRTNKDMKGWLEPNEEYIVKSFNMDLNDTYELILISEERMTPLPLSFKSLGGFTEDSVNNLFNYSV